jgi:hypothetical protein
MNTLTRADGERRAARKTPGYTRISRILLKAGVDKQTADTASRAFREYSTLAEGMKKSPKKLERQLERRYAEDYGPGCAKALVSQGATIINSGNVSIVKNFTGFYSKSAEQDLTLALEPISLEQKMEILRLANDAQPRLGALLILQAGLIMVGTSVGSVLLGKEGFIKHTGTSWGDFALRACDLAGAVALFGGTLLGIWSGAFFRPQERLVAFMAQVRNRMQEKENGGQYA